MRFNVNWCGLTSIDMSNGFSLLLSRSIWHLETVDRNSLSTSYLQRFAGIGHRLSELDGDCFGSLFSQLLGLLLFLGQFLSNGSLKSQVCMHLFVTG